ncbi:hypothetical protein K8O93_01235 [Gordonia bronchialis]|uniref:hypothetical protein n=1 Tax=Gordonia bronchialis TaxID=2054 RepID=UPI001CBF384F|nr:hypothetical protein [Gordonia bronchialis]UAK38458.1 hypothetical protein K8O93_01235 [Gordonia bronchialis]
MLPGSAPGELGGTYDHPTVTGWADKADLVAGKIPSSQIPAQATNERYVVADTAARLALTTAQVQPGDLAIQMGNPGRGTYILNDTDPSVEGNWILLPNPDAPVSSVNGYSGIVVLGKADVGLGNVDNTSDSNKPVSTAQQTALDGKANTSHAHSATDITSGTLDVARLPVGTGSTQVAAGNDGRFADARTLKVVALTTATAAAMAAKVVTGAGTVPASGDYVRLTFTSGNSAAAVTLAVNGGTAYPLRVGNAAITASEATAAAGGFMLLYFDGSAYHVVSAVHDTNTTYAEITEAEIDAGSASTARAISGRRVAYLLTKATPADGSITTAKLATDAVTVDKLASDVDALIAAKAVDTAVVHKTGAETVGGDKTFTGAVKVEQQWSPTQFANVLSAQYSAAGFQVLNTAATMTGAAGIQFSAFVGDSGATQTGVEIAKVDRTGALIAALVQFDLSDNRMVLFGSLDANSHKLVNVAPGTASTDAVNKAQLDAKVIPADMSIISFGKDTTRATGTGDNPFGVKVRRAVRIKTVHFRCLTADASGNLVVELRKNGTAISGSSVTIAAASQVAGSVSGTIDVDLAAGDILTVQVTGVGTTPGRGLTADIEAVVI